MEKQTTTIQVTSKSGIVFPIDVEVVNFKTSHSTCLKAGKAIVDLEAQMPDTNGQPCINVPGYMFKEAKPHLERYFPIKNRDARVCILIEKQEYSRIQKVVSEIEAPIAAACKAAAEDLKRRQDAQPRVWVAYSFLDWGDYSINHERNIFLCREPLPEEQQTLKVVECTANLWNSRIGDHKQEWEKIEGEKRKFKNLVDPCTVITAEEAAKWNRLSKEADQKEQDAKDAEEAAENAKQAAREAERKAKFLKAKLTGKRVLLSSDFLMGSDIPRKFRDEDSDMGNLNLWAMPDGSTQATFSHAH